MKINVNNECGSSVVVDFRNDSEGLTLHIRPIDKPVTGNLADKLRMQAVGSFARGGYVGASDAHTYTDAINERDEARHELAAYEKEIKRLHEVNEQLCKDLSAADKVGVTRVVMLDERQAEVNSLKIQLAAKCATLAAIALTVQSNKDYADSGIFIVRIE